MDIFVDTFISLLQFIMITGVGMVIIDSLVIMMYSEKDSYYTEIENLVQNGYTVYMNGSVVDIDKITISDYPNDKIHINDELKEIYISSSN